MKDGASQWCTIVANETPSKFIRSRWKLIILEETLPIDVQTSFQLKLDGREAVLFDCLVEGRIDLGITWFRSFAMIYNHADEWK